MGADPGEGSYRRALLDGGLPGVPVRRRVGRPADHGDLARLRAWPRVAVAVLACLVLSYSLYSSVVSQSDPLLRGLAYLDLVLIALAVAFALLPRPVIRRMDASEHWLAGRRARDALLREAPPVGAAGDARR